MVQYIDLWRLLRPIALSTALDTLCWRWTASATYSARSCYEALFFAHAKTPLAANMEVLGPAAHQAFPLAGYARPVLDDRPPSSSRPPPRAYMCPMRSGARDHATSSRVRSGMRFSPGCIAPRTSRMLTHPPGHGGLILATALLHRCVEDFHRSSSSPRGGSRNTASSMAIDPLFLASPRPSEKKRASRLRLSGLRNIIPKS